MASYDAPLLPRLLGGSFYGLVVRPNGAVSRLELMVLCFRSAEPKEIEIQVFCYELAALPRQHPCPACSPPAVH
jgi:hypothetical protein